MRVARDSSVPGAWVARLTSRWVDCIIVTRLRRWFQYTTDQQLNCVTNSIAVRARVSSEFAAGRVQSECSEPLYCTNNSRPDTFNRFIPKACKFPTKNLLTCGPIIHRIAAL